MHREHDERAKLIAEQALDRLGEVQRELEIPATDAMRFDLSLKRHLLADPLPTYVTLLAVLFDCDCMIEVFSRAVPLSDFWDSQLKQLAWRRQQQQKAKAQSGPTPMVRLPRLWIISAGRPEGLFAEQKVRQRAGFPRGIYDVGYGLNIGLVVVGELPLGRETLLLRLMGSESVCAQAAEELRSVADTDPEVEELRLLHGYLQHH